MRRFPSALVLVSSAVVALSFSSSGRAQSILTFAGGGSEDGRPATLVTLRGPDGVAVDTSGNVIFRDANVVRRIERASGVIVTIAGSGQQESAGDGGPATKAGFLLSSGDVAIDDDGNVFVADSVNFDWGVVRKVDAATGVISRVAGARTGTLQDGIAALDAPFVSIQGLQVDAAGNLFVADYSRIWRIDASSGLIRAVAGNGTFDDSGDGGPATAAGLGSFSGFLVAPDGDIFVAGNVVRRVDAATGIISRFAAEPAYALALDAGGNLYLGYDRTILRVPAAGGVALPFAGSGDFAFNGDGLPAATSGMSPGSVAVDSTGRLVFTDSRNARVRAIDLDSTIVTTIAGNGGSGFAGDGIPATQASLSEPLGVAFASDGSLLVADSRNNRIRSIATTGRITTYAGNGVGNFRGDSGPATSVSITAPTALAFDASGNLFFSDYAYVRRVDAATGQVTTIAGNGLNGYLGEGTPATQASLPSPNSIAVDGEGNIFIADTVAHRVRRVSASDRIIRVYAGTGDADYFPGDGVPATTARLNDPTGLAIAPDGSLLIADSSNHRIRRIDPATRVITTIAGNGQSAISGEGGPATAAGIGTPAYLATEPNGDIVFTSSGHVLRVRAGSGILDAVAGTGELLYAGDDGAATAASFGFATHLAVNAAGDIFVSDSVGNRVRRIPACVTLGNVTLDSPANGSSGTALSPRLGWNAVGGSFRYDVLLDRTNPPRTVVASELTDTVYVPSNLDPLTTYYWAIESRGDPFCPSVSQASSESRSFTTRSACVSPAGPGAEGPANGATGVATDTTFSWSASPGSSSYELYLGAGSQRSLVAATTQTSIALTGLAPGTTWGWHVVAIAACDSALRSAGPSRSFSTAGACSTPAAPALVSPANGAAARISETLRWNRSVNASGYDVYFGTQNPPLLVASALQVNELPVSGLARGATYYWKVVARSDCDAQRATSSSIAAFTVAQECAAPSVPTLVPQTQSTISVGGSYAISWTAIEGAASYIVERTHQTADASDRQETRLTGATFVADRAETSEHRVIAVASCDARLVSARSAGLPITVAAEQPAIIVSRPPTATVSELGASLEDKRTSFAIENLGSEPVTALVGTQEINGASPFFRIVDTEGGLSSAVTLLPRAPRTFEIRYSGPPVDRAASLEGLVRINTIGTPLAMAPMAWVNLRVGGSGESAPRFLVDGVESDFARFPAFEGDDTARLPITVDIANDGSEPLELGGEIGPEMWLRPETGWSATPVQPGSFRPVRLYTNRRNAPSGAGYPRFTYFTVRSRSGASAMILVQDSGPMPVGDGRGVAASAAISGRIVPLVEGGGLTDGTNEATELRLTNSSAAQVQVEVVFTPEGADGFAAAVKHATIVVPAGEIVRIRDVARTLFGLDGRVRGSLEIAAPESVLAALVVGATVSSDRQRVAVASASVPILRRNDGTRAGSSAVLDGIRVGSGQKADVILAETSGVEAVRAAIRLSGSNGVVVGERTVDVPRLGLLTLADAAAALGVPNASSPLRFTVEAISGGGSIASLAVTRNSSGAPLEIVLGQEREPDSAATRAKIVPAIAQQIATSSGGTRELRTALSLSASDDAPTSFDLRYRNAAGLEATGSVTVPARSSAQFTDALGELFGDSQGGGGSIVVTSSRPDGVIRASIRSSDGAVSESLPTLSSSDEALTGLRSRKPLFADGLEHLPSEADEQLLLVLEEVSGRPAVVELLVYESGNRTRPIASKTIAVRAFGQTVTERLFEAVGLASPMRQKDRANLEIIVRHSSGNGLVGGFLILVGSGSGDPEVRRLQAAGASDGLTGPFVTQPRDPRRRGVRRGG